MSVNRLRATVTAGWLGAGCGAAFTTSSSVWWASWLVAGVVVAVVLVETLWLRR